MTEPNDNPPPPPSGSAPIPPPAPGSSGAATDPATGGAQPAQPLPYQNPATPTGGGAMPYAGPAPTQDDKTMAMLAHLLGILTGFVGPLIIWLIKKDQSPFVDDQGKEALNFQLTLLIAWLIAGASTAICIGFLLVPAVLIIAIIFGIMAAMAANKGEAYRYPVNIRFIK
jgi:uncharacterized Tic20 family protein